MAARAVRRAVVSVALGLVSALAATALACSGGNGAPPTTPSPGPAPVSITISASGMVTPTETTVPPGTRVLIVNNDSRTHHLSSDPHPDHGDCPEINQAGVLAPGQRRETGNLVTVRTCGLHDHLDPTNPRLSGRIVIR